MGLLGVGREDKRSACLVVGVKSVATIWLTRRRSRRQRQNVVLRYKLLDLLIYPHRLSLLFGGLLCGAVGLDHNDAIQLRYNHIWRSRTIKLSYDSISHYLERSHILLLDWLGWLLWHLEWIDRCAVLPESEALPLPSPQGQPERPVTAWLKRIQRWMVLKR